MAKLSAEAKVGLLVVAGSVVLLWMTLVVGKFEFGAKKGYTIDAVFDSVAGLDAKAAVRMAGVKIGTVEKVELTDSRARVIMRIYPDVHIKRNVRAGIKTMGLLGEKFVEISPEEGGGGEAAPRGRGRLTVRLGGAGRRGRPHGRHPQARDTTLDDEELPEQDPDERADESPERAQPARDPQEGPRLLEHLVPVIKERIQDVRQDEPRHEHPRQHRVELDDVVAELLGAVGRDGSADEDARCDEDAERMDVGEVGQVDVRDHEVGAQAHV